MDQIYSLVGNYLLDHPKLLAVLVAYLVLQTCVKSFVDALVSSRAEWDKTPLEDNTWYEKAVTILGRVSVFMGKIAGYLVGFRPKPKSEIAQGIK